VGAQYLNACKKQADLEDMLKDPTLDADMKIFIWKKTIQVLLLPKDEEDEKNALLEIRTGIGGDEAALWGYLVLYASILCGSARVER